jgi:hypothetical protein
MVVGAPVFTTLVSGSPVGIYGCGRPPEPQRLHCRSTGAAHGCTDEESSKNKKPMADNGRISANAWSCGKANGVCVRFSLSGARKWLQCRQNGGAPKTCAARSAQTRGGRIAVAARNTFGPKPRKTALPKTAAVEKLLASMSRWNLTAVVQEIGRFFPRPVRGDITVYVVGNGHPYGDAYMRSVEWTPGAKQPRLSETGKPTVILNAVRIAAVYRGPATRRAAAALDVVRHESFHVLFQRFRGTASGWTKHNGNTTPVWPLLELLVNEGIAHFIGFRRRLTKSGFPLKRAKSPLTKIASLITKLQNKKLSKLRRRDMLLEANTGSFWSKFGSIGGMLMVYAVNKAFGVRGIKAVLRCGPHRLLTLYRKARLKLKNSSLGGQQLPALPAVITRAALAHRWCTRQSDD